MEPASTRTPMGTGPANRRSMRSAWRGSDAGAMTGFWISTSRASSISIDPDLLMRAVRKHTDCPWVLLYIERWLKAPVQMADGSLVARERGTPQGGVISPLLANLFLHYAFDVWMPRNHPAIPFERYADDVICHCRSEEQARTLRASLETRFAECGLTLHPEKTKIVYCKDDDRRGDYPDQKFDFLGYTFRPRLSRRRHGVRRIVQSGGQRQSAQGDPADRPTLDTCTNAATSRSTIWRGCSTPYSWLDQLLRPFL